MNFKNGIRKASMVRLLRVLLVFVIVAILFNCTAGEWNVFSTVGNAGLKEVFNEPQTIKSKTEITDQRVVKLEVLYLYSNIYEITLDSVPKYSYAIAVLNDYSTVIIRFPYKEKYLEYKEDVTVEGILVKNIDFEKDTIDFFSEEMYKYDVEEGYMDSSVELYKNGFADKVLDTVNYSRITKIYLPFFIPVIISFCVLGYVMLQLVYIISPRSHKMFKMLSEYGDENDILSNMDKDFKANRAVNIGKLWVTPDYIFNIQKAWMEKTDDLVWADWMMTTHSLYWGFGTVKSYAVKMLFKKNTKFQNVSGSRKNVIKMMDYLKETVPDLVIGDYNNFKKLNPYFADEQKDDNATENDTNSETDNK